MMTVYFNKNKWRRQMKRIIFLSLILLVTNNLLTCQKLTVANDTARMIHVVYSHKNSPKKFSSEKYLADEIVVIPSRLRRLPNTKTNPASIALKVDGKLLNGEIGLTPQCESLIINEYVKGKLVVSHGGDIVGEIEV